MDKIIEAEHLLEDAQSCVECISLAVEGLSEPVYSVSVIVSNKIGGALALLAECRAALPAPDRALARTKRRGK